MDKTKRKIVRSTLHKKCSVEKEQSKIIETAIYELSKRLHRETQEEIEELYCKFAYEKLGEIFAYPNKLDDILQNINDRIIGWDSVVYAEWKKSELSRRSERAEGIKMAEGEFKCKDSKCGSMVCFYYQEQKRGCDEPPTTFVVCTKCGERYSFN
jgi:DNA-directed RNA polymerase subunit M/transcription elongation factor TFIIS